MKSSDLDINDLIVDLYNGCKTANLRVGSRQLQSTAVIATNFDICKQERYAFVTWKWSLTFMFLFQGRAVTIEFELPTVEPNSEDEEEAYSRIEHLVANGTVSSAIGWAIALAKQLESKAILNNISKKLKKYFSGRSLKNWTMLLFFTHKVIIDV